MRSVYTTEVERMRLQAVSRKMPSTSRPGNPAYLIVLVGAVSLVSPTRAADVTGYAVLTSDYVFRGVSYSDGHASVQAGADVALQSGLYLGAWASSVDIGGGPAKVPQVRFVVHSIGSITPSIRSKCRRSSPV